MARKALTYDFSSQLGRDVASDDLVALMQEEDEFAEQRQILEEMRPKLREKFEQIQELVESEIHAVLRNRYALGEHFQALYDDETANGAKVYGKHAVQNICRLLGIDKTLVNNCMRFVQVYSRADLDILCTGCCRVASILSWSHVRLLVQEDDDQRRKELLEKTFDEGLTCSELAYAIKWRGRIKQRWSPTQDSSQLRRHGSAAEEGGGRVGAAKPEGLEPSHAFSGRQSC